MGHAHTQEPLRRSPLSSTFSEHGCTQLLPSCHSKEAPHTPYFSPHQKCVSRRDLVFILPAFVQKRIPRHLWGCKSDIETPLSLLLRCPHLASILPAEPHCFYGCQPRLDHKCRGFWPDAVHHPVQAILYRAATQSLKNINQMPPLYSESLNGFHSI